MSADSLLFIHPLLGVDDAWSGYLVEPASDTPPAPEALQRLCQHPTVGRFNRRLPWLIPVPPAPEMPCLIANPVYLFTQDAENTPARQESLRAAGKKTGLIVATGKPLPKTGTWDYLEIGVGQARTLPPYTLIGLASQTILLASKVHTHADHAWAKANAYSLCTGEFLLTRNNNGHHSDMTRLKLLEVLNLIAQDADTAELETVFRHEAKLSYSLLRLVNSAAMAPRSQITSFSQAINLLGRRQLQRWLQLLVFADPDNGHRANPLLQKAAARGHFMELLATRVLPQEATENIKDIAFMVGAFSLLDVLLNMSIGEILKQLPLPPLVSQAIVERQGALGQLLSLIAAVEARDYKTALSAVAQTGLDAEILLETQLTALHWAAQIHTTA